MSRHRFIRFLVIAAVLFLVLQRLYIFAREHQEAFLIDTLNGVPSAWVINTLTPDEKVVVKGGELVRRRAGSIDIKKGCEGFEVAILLISVMAAFPMTWRRKVAGIVLGVLLISVLNIIRIVSLFYLSIYKPQLFELFHLTIWQAIIILLSFIFFFFWIDRAGDMVPAANPGKKQNPDHET